MASQTRSAGTGQSIVLAGGSVHWLFPIRIYASDNSYATATVYVAQHSHWLRATNFEFEIPGGATIDGIKVEIEKKANDYLMYDKSVKIVKSGTESGTDKASGAEWPLPDTYITYGGTTDKWGLTWTSAQINATDFGVSISARFEGEEEDYAGAYVDHVRITVYYTEAPLTNMKINIGDWWEDIDEIKINIADTWKPVVGIWINIGDAWKKVFG